MKARVSNQLTVLLTLLMFSCGTAHDKLVVTISNPSEFDRGPETVSIPLADISLIDPDMDLENLVVKSVGSGEYLLTQLFDEDLDGAYDQLLFQAHLPAGGSEEFEIDRKSVV